MLRCAWPWPSESNVCSYFCSNNNKKLKQQKSGPGKSFIRSYIYNLRITNAKVRIQTKLSAVAKGEARGKVQIKIKKLKQLKQLKHHCSSRVVYNIYLKVVYFCFSFSFIFIINSNTQSGKQILTV
jgi:hypothetical protein